MCVHTDDVRATSGRPRLPTKYCKTVHRQPAGRVPTTSSLTVSTMQEISEERFVPGMRVSRLDAVTIHAQLFFRAALNGIMRAVFGAWVYEFWEDLPRRRIVIPSTDHDT